MAGRFELSGNGAALVFELTAGTLGVLLPETAPWMAVLLVLFFFRYEGGQRFMRRNWEQRTTQYQNQILEQQIAEVQNIYQTMRGWRHDYHNHMQVLKAYLTAGQEEQAEAYLERLEKDLNHVAQWIETGNVRVDVIVNSKISLAMQNAIDVNYKVTVPEHLTVLNPLLVAGVLFLSLVQVIVYRKALNYQ